MRTGEAHTHLAANVMAFTSVERCTDTYVRESLVYHVRNLPAGAREELSTLKRLEVDFQVRP